MNTFRRALMARAAGLGMAAALPGAALAQQAADAASPAPSARRFDPAPGDWRTFDVTARVDLPATTSATRVWLPLPALQAPWQQTLGHQFSSNGAARLASDGAQGVRMVAAEFAAGVAQPFVEVTSRVRTQSRAVSARSAREDAATLRDALKPTRLIPTDGIVRDTALKATRGARGDEAQARALYDWVIANAWREPKVRGCGEGDIKTMLETGNLGGKCADLNALFVGLCRSVGLPARDVYGIRLAPSAFDYKELGAASAKLQGAPHCRAEVYLQARGWTAMDPADVAKVMRQEAPEWIKTRDHPLVRPVYEGLFGGWEGNWMAYNTAHDVKLPGAQEGELGFFMYPVAENAEERFDSYAPDAFKYQITARSGGLIQLLVNQ
ncbi:transglutaminase-like domain-containing protein [Ottowia testudinis]|uniref:Transglutaminase domain-containing protein n=1 Tax=Ottowia testudinis TaxID=2816950 RepID=A0A975H529_9BURK|nr:transglutaminase domain-containing protein [Ottowia testudinis]QTD46936.1 transglutaminase domain-containing protein [Ottowia testudinis]